MRASVSSSNLRMAGGTHSLAYGVSRTAIFFVLPAGGSLQLSCSVARPEVLRRAYLVGSAARPSEYLRACHTRSHHNTNKTILPPFPPAAAALPPAGARPWP